MAETSRIRPNFRNAVLAPDMVATAFDAVDADLKDAIQVVTAGDGTGIVATAEPSASGSPLWVSPVTDKPLLWDVSPGTAVTASGRFLTTTDIVQVSLVSIEQDAVNLVIIRPVSTPLGHYVVSSVGDVVDAGELETAEIGCITLEAYTNLRSTANSSVLGDINYEDIVVLGVIVWDISAGPIRYTAPTTEYPWLRPWFSAVDVTHRSKLGTGTVTDTNPHGLSLADLLLGESPIYDHLTSSGMLMSRDYSTTGIPGIYCYQRFLQDAVKIDNSGEITKESPYGGLGARYVLLNSYPNTIASIHKVGTKREMCGSVIPRSNIVVFAREESINDSIDVWFYKTDSLSVTSSAQTSVTFSTMVNSDLVITKGQALSSVGNTTLQFRRYGNVPRSLTALVAPTGKLFADPYVVVPSTLVVEAQREQQSNQIELYAPSQIGVGVSYFAAVDTAYLAVRVSGTDVNGDAISEVVEFRGSSVEEASVGSSAESASQVVFAQATFYSLTSWEIVTDQAFAPAGLNFGCSVSVYAKTDIAKSKLAQVATMQWTGSAVTNVRDARRILPVVTDGEYGLTPITQAAESIGLASQVTAIAHHKIPLKLICAEDFRQPKFLNITKCAWRGPKLQTPVIKSIHALSTNNVDCYKSKLIPTVMSATYTFQVCVILFGNDVTAEQGSVRCIVRDWQDVEYETIMAPYSADSSNRTFLSYYNRPIRAVSFVISGTANGFAAFIAQDETPDAAYFTHFTLTGK